MPNNNFNTTPPESSDENHANKSQLELNNQDIASAKPNDEDSIIFMLRQIIDQNKSLKEQLNQIEIMLTPQLTQQASSLKTNSTQTNKSESIRRKTKYEPPINPNEFLSKNGEESLRKELDKFTNTELIDMIYFFTQKTKKSLQKLERSVLIKEVIDYGNRVISKGSRLK